MASITLRPDLKTAGGEVSDIIFNKRYVGTISLVYREGDRMSGSIQLEEESISNSDKRKVIQYAQDYVQSLIQALAVEQCDVIVTHSSFDKVIATDDYDMEFMDDEGFDMIEDDFNDVDPYQRDTMEMDTEVVEALDDEDEEVQYLELVLINENSHEAEYHIYDEEQSLIAEAYFYIQDGEVEGEVHWMSEPSEDEIEIIMDLLVSDFDEDEVDSFSVDMIYDGIVIESIELMHDDLIDEDQLTIASLGEDEEVYAAMSEELDEEQLLDYSIVLVRDDGDTLSYDIYQRSHGGLPIGTATVDISHKQLTGFIDFREPGTEDDRELIATLLMRELDKEKDYDTFNVTMLHENRPIDEIHFEAEYH